MAGEVGFEPTTYGFGIHRSTVRATLLKTTLTPEKKATAIAVAVSSQNNRVTDVTQ